MRFDSARNMTQWQNCAARAAAIRLILDHENADYAT